jgi:ribosome-associated protein
VDRERIIQELEFKAVRSGGAGGQHVNKVSSKVELSFNIPSSTALTEEEKQRIYLKLAPRLTKENILLLQTDESRSQHRNKELVIQKFLDLLKNALKVPKKRRKTVPTKSAIEKRLRSKQKKAEKKAFREKPKLD